MREGGGEAFSTVCDTIMTTSKTVVWSHAPWQQKNILSFSSSWTYSLCCWFSFLPSTALAQCDFQHGCRSVLCSGRALLHNMGASSLFTNKLYFNTTAKSINQYWTQ